MRRKSDIQVGITGDNLDQIFIWDNAEYNSMKTGNIKHSINPGVRLKLEASEMDKFKEWLTTHNEFAVTE